MTARQPSSDDPLVLAGPDAHGVGPTDLLRAMLAISPEDAASAREDAAEAMESHASAQDDEDRAHAVRKGDRTKQ